MPIYEIVNDQAREANIGDRNAVINSRTPPSPQNRLIISCPHQPPNLNQSCYWTSCHLLGFGASCASCVFCRAHWRHTDHQARLQSQHSCHMSCHHATIRDVRSRDAMSRKQDRHRGACASSSFCPCRRLACWQPRHHQAHRAYRDRLDDPGKRQQYHQEASCLDRARLLRPQDPSHLAAHSDRHMRLVLSIGLAVVRHTEHADLLVGTASDRAAGRTVAVGHTALEVVGCIRPDCSLGRSPAGVVERCSLDLVVGTGYDFAVHHTGPMRLVPGRIAVAVDLDYSHLGCCSLDSTDRSNRCWPCLKWKWECRR